MRTIKFRGKSLNTGMWVYGDLQHKGKREFIEYEVDPITVGQYTGLKDKNGKEIYEGDILQCSSVLYIPLEVCYNALQGAFCLIEHTHTEGALLGTCPIGEMLHYYPDMHVIGNIHDNPELIKGGVK